MIQRYITARLLAALADTPVVVLQGARQTGKSTLAQQISEVYHPSLYLTMDNITTLIAAQQDPVGFLQGLRGQDVILDEIQRVPELFLPLKAEVDRERRSGRFLLTGSANALLVPHLAETLVGRLEVLTLWPLSQVEIAQSEIAQSKYSPNELAAEQTSGQEQGFLGIAFAQEPLPVKQYVTDRSDVIARALRGGYPEAVARTSEERRLDWFDAYVTTLLQRDVRDLAQIQGLSELPRLLSLVAAQSTAVLNASDLARSAGMALTTLNRYLTLLQATFLVQQIPAWSTNLSKRVVKSPKLLLTDTGILAALTGMSTGQFETTPALVGMLIENFVGMELLKLLSWSSRRLQLFHFRTHDRKEVDFLLQDRMGGIVGMEVKAASAVQQTDFRGLQALAEIAGSHFVNGFVFYTGDTLLPFGEHMYAVPIAALWEQP
ncbi:MAG: ATP-binding protein [Caldilineaceae bacterium]|nr:ATP-binding protein [Caldilineaceae bacterium]